MFSLSAMINLGEMLNKLPHSSTSFIAEAIEADSFVFEDKLRRGRILYDARLLFLDHFFLPIISYQRSEIFSITWANHIFRVPNND